MTWAGTSCRRKRGRASRPRCPWRGGRVGGGLATSGPQGASSSGSCREGGPCRRETGQTTSFIIWILVAAASFGYVLSYLQAPQQLVTWVTSLDVNRYVIIVFINLLLFLLGCIMDPAAIIMITIPIFAPLVQALGFDLVWFGVMFVVNMELAEITPPLGLNLYIMKSVSPPEVTLNDIIRGAIPFMLLDITGVALVIIFPSLILWLPSTMM